MKSRIIILFTLFLAAWSLLVTRAAFLQIFPNKKFDVLERKQFETEITIASKRGAIFDREGNELALSQPAYSVYADPKLIIDGQKALSRKLAKELSLPIKTVYLKLNDHKKRYVSLAKQISVQTMEKIKFLNIHGIGFTDEPKRVYPNENLMLQSIGMVGSEGKGLEGLELRYDSELSGKAKSFLVRKDARGRPLITESERLLDAPEGADLYLTVDRDIQYVLERELSRALRDSEAKGAMGIVLDAETSAILGAATLPAGGHNYNGNEDAGLKRNRVLTDAFEPGSTLKTFVIAGALRQKLLKPNSKYFCENGQFKIGGRVIREAEASHNFGWLTVSEVLALSSNIGTTKISFQLGQVGLRQVLDDFGFGAKTGVDFPGESTGILKPLPWHDHLISNISFGHGIAVTPLQIANAYAAIANGGMLNQPYLVKKIVNFEHKEENKEFSTKPIRRVLTADEASKMKMMLTAVTSEGGTGVNARVPGYLVAGKTGTAQKVNPTGKGYLKGDYISSFAGFIPAQDPKFVIYVVFDSPKKNYYGSQVAAPAFSRIASFVVRKAGVPPSILNEKEITQASNITAKVEDEREVFDQKSGVQKVSLANKEKFEVKKEIHSKIPNLNNLSLREALSELSDRGLKVKIERMTLNESQDKKSSAMGDLRIRDSIPRSGEEWPSKGETFILLY